MISYLEQILEQIKWWSRESRISRPSKKTRGEVVEGLAARCDMMRDGGQFDQRQLPLSSAGLEEEV